MVNLRRLTNGIIDINNLNVNVEAFNTFYGKYSFCYDYNYYFVKICDEKEIFNEIFAAKFADKMGINHANYDICRYNGDLGAISTSVYKGEEKFIPLIVASLDTIPKNGTANTIQSMKRYILPSLCFFNQNEELKKYIDIFMFDILLGNGDRHEDNIGFIKNKNKYSIAPIFDNGNIGKDVAVFQHIYSQGLDNRKYDPTSISDTIYEIFMNKKYGKILATYLEKYSFKDFEEIVKSINEEYTYEFDKEYEIFLLNRLKSNLKILNEFKVDFYDSKRLKRG